MSDRGTIGLLAREVKRIDSHYSRYIIFTSLIFVVITIFLIWVWVLVSPVWLNFLSILFLLTQVSLMAIAYIRIVEIASNKYIAKITEFYNRTLLQYLEAKKREEEDYGRRAG